VINKYTLSTRLSSGLPVNIQFEYEPGEPEHILGRAEDCNPAGGPHLQLTAVWAHGANRVSHNRLDAVSAVELERLEALCLAHVEPPRA